MDTSLKQVSRVNLDSGAEKVILKEKLEAQGLNKVSGNEIKPLNFCLVIRPINKFTVSSSASDSYFLLVYCICEVPSNQKSVLLIMSEITKTTNHSAFHYHVV